MPLTEQDRVEISDLINLHGHLTDAGELDLAGRLFTPDVVYDLSDFGMGTLQGIAALQESARASGAANPVGHHVTNIVITAIDERSAGVRSKGLGVKADGSVGSVVYEDVVTRRPEGWRISRRKVTARRAPLGMSEAGAEAGAGPREVLERWRRAAVDQSVADLRAAYAPDAVHEFPFVFPGAPARLEGRDEIVDWIAAGWKTGALRYERYRTLAVHETGSPETIIVEQEAVGTGTATGRFTLPNIVVLTAREGQITHLRDYVDVPAAAKALGAGSPAAAFGGASPSES